MSKQALRTSVVGSYPQPDWLIDREALSGMVPRVRVRDIWRVDESLLEQAQDDATRLAIADMEAAGVDIITDGEIRRESYSNRFATMLDGVDLEHPGEVIGRTGKPTVVPRVVGPIRRREPVQLRDMRFLREHTGHVAKITLPGPFTLSMQAQDEYYRDEQALAMAYAEAVREEMLDLFAAGADIVQLDEPWMQARPEQARRFAVDAINHALRDAPGSTAVHMCFGYAQTVKDKPHGYSFLPELEHTVASQISIEAAQPELDLGVLEQLPSKQILLGVISMGTQTPETPEQVADRIRPALRHVPPERLIIAPDCGMKYLPRDSAFAKLRAMVDGTAMVRRELGID
ncbi:MAG: cobalamin-independent methionine synthase II family protein [Gammaproteobacteria bacterium]|nr:cobalamin-independent methionine synthase II family protein [Gammaproteobacteria bacterium]